jgi:hypothetical protein
MGEVIRFIPKSELDRARLIREARAMYSRWPFPSASSGTPSDKKEVVSAVIATKAKPAAASVPR